MKDDIIIPEMMYIFTDTSIQISTFSLKIASIGFSKFNNRFFHELRSLNLPESVVSRHIHVI